MPTLPPTAASDWLPDTVRGEFEALHASHMPHRADIKRAIYARSNGASVPSWPVTTPDQPCRVVPVANAQQRIGEQPVSADRYEVVFMVTPESSVLKQGDRLDVVGRNSQDTTFALALELLDASFGKSGTILTALCSALRSPANL